MSVDTVFKPTGALTLVGVTPIQVAITDGAGLATYHVRCLVTGYFAWGQTAAKATSNLTNTPPVAGVPAPQAIGMTVGAVEVFEIPAGVFIVASAAAAFEMIAGQGA